MNRQILGAVLQSGRLYVAGDEAALALVLPPFDVARLVAKGVLACAWLAEPEASPVVPLAFALQPPDESLAPVATVDEPTAPTAVAPDAPAVAPRVPKAKASVKRSPHKTKRNR